MFYISLFGIIEGQPQELEEPMLPSELKRQKSFRLMILAVFIAGGFFIMPTFETRLFFVNVLSSGFYSVFQLRKTFLKGLGLVICALNVYNTGISVFSHNDSEILMPLVLSTFFQLAAIAMCFVVFFDLLITHAKVIAEDKYRLK